MMFPTLRAFSHPFSIHHMSSREQRKTTLLVRISGRKEFRGSKMRPTGEGQSKFPHSNCCDNPFTLRTQELTPNWRFVGKPEVTADLYSEPPSHHQSENRVAHALLHTFGVWGIQGKLELLHELCHLQAVCQSVVYVDRYWHGAAVVCLSNFAEGDARRGVFVGEVARMRDGCEVEPGKN